MNSSESTSAASSERHATDYRIHDSAQPGKRTYPWFLIPGMFVVLVAALLAVAHFEWPQPTLLIDGQAIARLDSSSLAGTATEMTAHTASEGDVALQLRQGFLWPSSELSAGEKVDVRVTVKRSRWVGWLVGSTKTVDLSLTTPSAAPDSSMIETPAGHTVSVHLSAPVARVSLDGAAAVSLSAPTSTVSLGPVAGSPNSWGRLKIAVAARSWETLQTPVTLSWFVKQAYAQVACSPAAGSTVSPSQRLTLTFSRPVAAVVGTDYSILVTSSQGSWQKVDDYTLTYQPSGVGYSLGGTVTVTLPQAIGVGQGSRLTSTLRWTVKTGSTLRLQQLLAQLGYLPLTWQAGGASVSLTMQAQLDAATSPPAGQFSWAYSTTPQQLVSLWREGQSNVILRGAIMAFEDTHGLGVDASAGEKVWAALFADVLAGKRSTRAYSYVYVSKSLPQTLHLWSAGSVVFTSPCNTGIAAAPTAVGTYPVFMHITSGTMHGTNPDGTKYNDPGVRYISYFNHGDALHAFTRASYGTPQSLGCVELPLASAAKIWPYTPIGTLVTIQG